MARRRNSPPPLEVMGHHLPTRQLQKQPPDQDIPKVPDAEAVRVTWWSSGKQPIVLRLPRGYAVVLGLLLVALLILAYLVGYTSGKRSGHDEARAAYEIQAQTTFHLSPFPIDREPAGGLPDTTEPAVSGGDPRIPGLNYLQLASYPRDAEKEANRLYEFLKTKGVETITKPADNGGLYVTAVNRGFTGGDLKTQECKDYELRMRQVGRAWKQHNNSRGDALESMLFVKYQTRN